MKHRNEFQRRIGVGERQYRYGRYVGTSKDIQVRREDNGKLAGKQTEHWDGSVDATVYPETARRVMSRSTGEIEPL